MATSTKSIDRREYRHVLELLRAVRLEAGLSQAALSLELGHKQTWTSAVELGQTRLDPLQLHLWMVACGTDLVAFAHRLQAVLNKTPQRKQVGKRLGQKNLPRPTLKTVAAEQRARKGEG